MRQGDQGNKSQYSFREKHMLSIHGQFLVIPVIETLKILSVVGTRRFYKSKKVSFPPLPSGPLQTNNIEPQGEVKTQGLTPETKQNPFDMWGIWCVRYLHHEEKTEKEKDQGNPEAESKNGEARPNSGANGYRQHQHNTINTTHRAQVGRAGGGCMYIWFKDGMKYIG